MTTPVRPYVLADGLGNTPSAAKWNDNDDWMIGLAFRNSLFNAGFESWLGGNSFTNPAHAATIVDFWSYSKTGTSLPTTDLSRESTTIDTGEYSLKVNTTGAGHADSRLLFYQDLGTYKRLRGVNVLAGARVKVATASKVRIKIDDGVNAAAYGTYHTGDNTWQTITATLAVSSTATQLRVAIEVTSDFTGAVYIDGAYIYSVPSGLSTNTKAYLKYFPQLPNPVDVDLLPVTSVGQVRGVVGSVTVPTYSTFLYPTTGAYFGANTVAIACSGTKIAEFLSTGMNLTAGNLDIASGTEPNFYVSSTGGPQFRVNASLANTTIYIQSQNNYSMALGINNAFTSILLDTNKDVVLTSAVVATNGTGGFVYISTCAGTPTGVPTARSGRCAIIFDTTGNKFWVYDGGWIGVVLA